MTGRARRWTSGLLAVLVVVSGLALAQAPVAADEPAPTYPAGPDRTPPPDPAPAPVAGTSDVNPVTVTGSRGTPSARWLASGAGAQESRLPDESATMGPASDFTSLVQTYPSYCWAFVDNPAPTADRVVSVDCFRRGRNGPLEERPYLCLYDRVYFPAGTRVVGACPGDPGAYDPKGCVKPGSFAVLSCAASQDPAGDPPAPYFDGCRNHLHDPAWVKDPSCRTRPTLTLEEVSSPPVFSNLLRGRHRFQVSATNPTGGPLDSASVLTVRFRDGRSGRESVQTMPIGSAPVTVEHDVTDDVTVSASVAESSDHLAASTRRTWSVGTTVGFEHQPRTRTYTLVVNPGARQSFRVDRMAEVKVGSFVTKELPPRADRIRASRAFRKQREVCRARHTPVKTRYDKYDKCVAKAVKRRTKALKRRSVSHDITGLGWVHWRTVTLDANGRTRFTFPAVAEGVPDWWRITAVVADPDLPRIEIQPQQDFLPG